MTTMPTKWQVQPTRRGASAKVLALPLAAPIALVAVLHTSAMLIGGLVAIPVAAILFAGVVGAFRWEQSRMLAKAPPGTLVACTGGARLQPLRDTPRFAAIAAGRRGRFLSGTVTIDAEGIRLAPMRPRPDAPPTVGVRWDEVADLRASVTPGKVNIGSIDVTVRDGSHLCVQVSGYSRMVRALDSLQGGGATESVPVP